MSHLLRTGFAIVFVAVLHGCTGLYQRPDEITGNSTGGVVPPKMAATQNVQSLANAHCGKWGMSARITFPASQTEAEAVFVCETPAQAAASQGSNNPEAGPEPQTKSKSKARK